MDFIKLGCKKEIKPLIAKWYFDQWGKNIQDSTLLSFNRKLEDYLNIDHIPFVILAIENGTVLGAAHIRFHEMTIYPEKTHWLGGVYVDKPHRAKGVAKSLVKHMEELAISFNIMTLHLQTENLTGGLYAALGWQPDEQVNYNGVDVLVMSKQLI